MNLADFNILINSLNYNYTPKYSSDIGSDSGLL